MVDYDKENSSTPICQKKIDTPDKTETPFKNRFSFSKLTSFMSKSALKAINRKSFGSDSSSLDTSLNLLQADNEEHLKQENFNSKIYISLEQKLAIENKIASMERFSKVSKAFKPRMGISSLMIKEMKTKSKSLAGVTFLPNTYMVAMPITFKNEEIKNNNYDKLIKEPVPFISEDRASKKMAKPMVKSLSSIQPVFKSSSCKNLTPSPKLKKPSISPILTPVNQCRISIYSSKSDMKLEKRLQFESFSEAVF